jgi:hypothetical protein
MYNCVAFVGDIAAFLGMQHPFHWVMPKEYIQGIRSMNGGRTQLPASWLASKNPQLARQQALHQVAAHPAQPEPAAAQPQAQQPTPARRAAVTRTAAPRPAEPTFAGVH